MIIRVHNRANQFCTFTLYILHSLCLKNYHTISFVLNRFCIFTKDLILKAGDGFWFLQGRAGLKKYSLEVLNSKFKTQSESWILNSKPVPALEFEIHTYFHSTNLNTTNIDTLVFSYFKTKLKLILIGVFAAVSWSVFSFWILFSSVVVESPACFLFWFLLTLSISIVSSCAHLLSSQLSLSFVHLSRTEHLRPSFFALLKFVCMLWQRSFGDLQI